MHNPLADKSVSLWKTLHIWAEELGNNLPLLENTELHLVTNGTLPLDCFAKRLNNASEKAECTKVANELVLQAQKLRDDMAKYGKTIIKLPIKTLEVMISRIFVFDNVSPRFGGNLEEIQSLSYFSDSDKVSIFDQMCGWVRRRIRYLVENNLPSRILREEFDKEVRALIRRIRVAPLNALVATPITDPNVEAFELAGFVKQLDWIESDETVIREAIIHYVQARDTRIKWTDSDVVSENALKIYFDDLASRWRRIKRQVERKSWPTMEVQGQECFDLTISEDTSLDGEQMPKAVSCGNFHALADFTPSESPIIGWHPEFLKLAKKKKEGHK